MKRTWVNTLTCVKRVDALVVTTDKCAIVLSGQKWRFNSSNYIGSTYLLSLVQKTWKGKIKKGNN